MLSKILFLNLLAQEQLDTKFWAMVTLLSPLWVAIQSQFSGFWLSSPVLWVTIFWLSDVVLGLTLAVKNEDFKPHKLALGVCRWFAWFVILMVSWGIRVSIFGGPLIAGVIESIIILAEGSSVIRNLGLLSGNSNPRLTKILSFYADIIDVQIDKKIGSLNKDVELPNNTTKKSL